MINASELDRLEKDRKVNEVLGRVLILLIALLGAILII